MSDEQIYELAKDKALDIQKYIIDGNVDIDSFTKDCCLAGAHSRDEEIEKLESLLDKAVQILREAYSGSDFFCERLHEIPEEDLYCMTYCDKDDVRYDCILRYLKHYKKGE